MAEQASIRTFVAPVKGSGRLAPTLIEDLTLYDPYSAPRYGNLLDTPPIKNGNLHFLGQILQEDSCRHALYLQPRQSKRPAIDERPNQTSKYQTTAFCRICRVHITLTVDYTLRWKGTPCPHADRPLHHLIYSEYNTDLARDNFLRDNPDQYSQIYVYECSSATCSAIITIVLVPAVLTEDNVELLTSKELLKKRTDEAFEVHKANTEGMKHPSAVDVLMDLKAYIGNSWNPDARTDIALDNKRLAVRFGPEGNACQELLESLGFVRKAASWQIPKPISNDSGENIPLRYHQNKFLDNLEHELSALILSQPEEDRRAAQYTARLEDARIEFARAMGCQSYDRSPIPKTSKLLPERRQPPFIVLGTPEDAGDSIIECAYDWQCFTNPEYAPTYLSALRDVTIERGSETLQLRIAIEESKGKVDQEQMNAAYANLGLTWTPDPNEAHIIGTFNSRLADSPAQEAQLREHLRIIGVGMRNRKIEDYANQEMTTYEHALEFLNADSESDDSYIQTLYSLKVTESPTQNVLARKAVRIIAQHRGSESLQSFVKRGFTSHAADNMDIGEAFSTLGIDDRTMDDATILSIYEIRKADDVSNSDRCTRAIRTIAIERNSAELKKALNMEDSEQSQLVLTEPVGLDNIGNTCYLNSLLQFLFTVKSVRDIVLNFEGYKMDPSPEAMIAKKVGQRKISLKEVEIGQKFAERLGRLFQDMITSAQPAIRPEQELARLTLETDTVKDKIRRRSTVNATSRPNLGTLDSMPVYGPLPESVPQSNSILTTKLQIPERSEVIDDNDSTKAVGSSPVDVDDLNEIGSDGDNSSEATLVSQPGSNEDMEAVTAEQQQAILDNKENLAPTKNLDFKEVGAVTSEPLRPASPSKMNAQAGNLSSQTSHLNSSATVAPEPTVYKPPPGPPPVPPRKPVQTNTSTLEEYARQQDVTEVISHCLYQLSSAMRPTGTETSGEQRDEIHDLFFGEMRRHTLPSSENHVDLTFLNVQASVHNEPKDVYAALDTWFDLTAIDTGRSEYVSITRMPPVLTIALGRVVWDTVTRSQKKLDHHVELLEEIYMDRYLEAEADSDLLQKRMEVWKLKERLLNLEEKRVFYEQPLAGAKDVATLFDDAKEAVKFLRDHVDGDERFGGPLPVEVSLPTMLGSYSKEARKRTEAIKQEVMDIKQRISDIFNGFEKEPYVLHAAFFHRGSYGSGHYWVYIKDHIKGLWRKYNDDHVTVVRDMKEIFDKPDTTGGWSGPATPYVLVYIRKGIDNEALDSIIETVKRDAIQISAPSAESSPPEEDLIPLGSSGLMTAPSTMNTGQTQNQSVRFEIDEMETKAASLMPPSTGTMQDGNGGVPDQPAEGNAWDKQEAFVNDPSIWYR